MMWPARFYRSTSDRRVPQFFISLHPQTVKHFLDRTPPFPLQRPQQNISAQIHKSWCICHQSVHRLLWQSPRAERAGAGRAGLAVLLTRVSLSHPGQAACATAVPAACSETWTDIIHEVFQIPEFVNKPSRASGSHCARRHSNPAYFSSLQPQEFWETGVIFQYQ